MRLRKNQREYRRVHIRVSVANLIQSMRMLSGLTQTDLAERLGMLQPEISHLERAMGSRTAELSTVVRIADECGFVVELVATRKGGRNRPPQVERVLLTPPGP